MAPSFSSSQDRLSSLTTSKIPIFRTSAFVTPKTRHARSFAASIVYGDVLSVVNIACAAGAHRLEWPCTAGPMGWDVDTTKDEGPVPDTVGERNCSCNVSPETKGRPNASKRVFCKAIGPVSVNVRIKLGRLVTGGEVLAVDWLSSDRVLDDACESN